MGPTCQVCSLKEISVLKTVLFQPRSMKQLPEFGVIPSVRVEGEVTASFPEKHPTHDLSSVGIAGQGFDQRSV